VRSAPEGWPGNKRFDSTRRLNVDNDLRCFALPAAWRTGYPLVDHHEAFAAHRAATRKGHES